MAEEARDEFVDVFTMYKRKADKVRPVEADVTLTDGSTPGGLVAWREDCLKREALLPPGTGPFDGTLLIKKFSSIPRGSRLTAERIKALVTGTELRPRERELFLEMMFNREAALSWDFSEIGRVRPEVAPPQEIRTVEHKPWQHPGFKIHRSLTGVVENIVRERLKNGVLEPCYSAYRNP
jgi:hypothetical protein